MAKQPTGMFDYVSQTGKTFLNKGRQYTSPTPRRTGATIDLSPLKTAPKGGAGGLESRQIPAAIQEAGPEAMSVEGGEASMQPQMVTETQQPIENRGGSARYMIQGGGPKIDLSFLVPERANKAFDPSKAIGGENVPYKESKGVGGFLRRLLGDESNKQNIEAQQVQGAKWEAENARTKERAERKQDLLEEIDAREKDPNARFNKTEARLAKDAETAARERQLDRDRAFLEGNRNWVAGEETRRREEARDAATQGFQNRQVTLAEDVANNTRFQSVSDGKGGVYVINETTGQPVGSWSADTVGMVQDPAYPKDPSKKIGGTIRGGWNPYVPPAKAPPNPNPGSNQVNRGDGSTLGGPLTTPRSGEVSLGSEELPPGGLPDPGVVNLGGKLPPPPLPQNTALGPRFMQGTGEVLGSAATSATDPLRSMGTGLNQLLFNSNAQQDPEVLKRMKARGAVRGPENSIDYVPMF
jgi:hypothetical protein